MTRSHRGCWGRTWGAATPTLLETCPLSTPESSAPKSHRGTPGTRLVPHPPDGSPLPPPSPRGSAPRGAPPPLHSATPESLGPQRKAEPHGSGNFCRHLLSKHSFPPPRGFGHAYAPRHRICPRLLQAAWPRVVSLHPRLPVPRKTPEPHFPLGGCPAPPRETLPRTAVWNAPGGFAGGRRLLAHTLSDLRHVPACLLWFSRTEI